LAKSYQARFPAPRGIGVNKDEADVLAKISASLAKLKANGTVQMLFAKYGVESVLVNVTAAVSPQSSGGVYSRRLLLQPNDEACHDRQREHGVTMAKPCERTRRVLR